MFMIIDQMVSNRLRVGNDPKSAQAERNLIKRRMIDRCSTVLTRARLILMWVVSKMILTFSPLWCVSDCKNIWSSRMNQTVLLTNMPFFIKQRKWWRNCWIENIVNMSLKLWRHTNTKKRALNKMPCGKKENCHSWRRIGICRRSL